MSLLNNRSHSHGFTLLEIVITLIVISILSSLAVVQYSKMAASTALEKAAWLVYSDLSGVRNIAMKYDCQGVAKFKNRGYVIDRVVRKDTVNLPNYIGFGVPVNGPSSNPFGIAISSDSGAKGNWKDSLLVNRDAIGSINTGFVIIGSSKLKGNAYFIGTSGTYQGIMMYKWTGGSWVKM